MKLRSLIVLFLLLWLGWAFMVPRVFDNLEIAGGYGDSFGGISALFSGLALALAIYSMVLQQRQSAEFERATLGALAQQSKAIKLIEDGLLAQANQARVTAVLYLIESEGKRIDQLREWGEKKGDENRYQGGIDAAQRRIDEYREQLKRYASQ